MGKQLFLVQGKAGSGKTTASALAAVQLGGVYHFSMGEEVRARALHGKASRYSTELKQYAQELKQALPIPAHLAKLVFEECVQTSPYDTIIVDGYPQYPDRLPSFNATLQKLDAQVLAVGLIEIPDATARQRLHGRSRRSNVVEDDAYISKRLASYKQNVIPVIEAFAQIYPVHAIDGSLGSPQVASQLVKLIQSYQLNQKV